MTADAINSDRSRLLSNYEIRKDDRYEDLFPEMLMDKSLHDAIILLDEVYAWLESRTSGRDINRYMSYILFQARKKDIDFYMTEQLLSTVDLRYRDMIDFEVRCKAVPNYKHPVGFQYRIIDVLEKKIYPMYLTIDAASKYFSYYDSYQPISPIDDEMMVKISKNKTSIIEEIDGIVDYLMNEGPNPGKISKGVVSDYCLRNGYPKSYVDMAHNALKARLARVRD
jgi:hypothetical protein